MGPVPRRAAASNKAAAPKVSAEAERRSRIAHMQRLYGLGASSPQDSTLQGCVPSGATATQAAQPAPLNAISNDIDSVSSREWLPQDQVMDPLASNSPIVTVNGADEEDLIAWSKMLKPE